MKICSSDARLLLLQFHSFGKQCRLSTFLPHEAGVPSAGSTRLVPSWRWFVRPVCTTSVPRHPFIPHHTVQVIPVLSRHNKKIASCTVSATRSPPSVSTYPLCRQEQTRICEVKTRTLLSTAQFLDLHIYRHYQCCFVLLFSGTCHLSTQSINVKFAS